MNFELSQLNKAPKKEALDEKWYGQFEKIAAFQDYEYLNGDKKKRAEQKTLFLEGKNENPQLDYPDLEKIDFEAKERALLELKKSIFENEANEGVRLAYRWKLNEKIAELCMLKAAKEGNDRKFYRYSKFIYGEPDRNIFEFTINKDKALIDDKKNSKYIDIRLAAAKLSEYFKDASKPDENSRKVMPIPIQSSPLAFIGENPEFNANEIKNAFMGALDLFQSRGFKVIVDESGKVRNINISQEKKQAIIPNDRKVKLKNLQSLIIHEIGTHIKRRTSGECSNLKLLGLGLDRFIRGEEGIATHAEQNIKGADDYAGLSYHLAISLACGLDGKKRSFRDVFEILKNYFLVKSNKNKKEEAVKDANDQAWNSCVRVFRGTTGKTPGACFTRDIVYREGNIGIWNVVKNNPDEIKRFSVGKYDPANSRHIWILEQLGINESDLEELEK